MNNKGYTLAEALITLGIIGVIAALVVPAANKARPNQNKLKFLQTYDAIETQIKNFASNTRYFPTCQDFDDGNGMICFPDYPLYNTSGGVVDERNIPILVSTLGSNPPNRPLPSNYDSALNSDGPDKLCYLLADAMDAITPMGNRCGNNDPSFVTPNGVAFSFLFPGGSVHDAPRARANGRTYFLKYITFDVDNQGFGNNGGSTDDPTAFTIAVTADGNVYPSDSASIFYLANRKDTRQKFNMGMGFNIFEGIQPDNDDTRAQVIFSN